MIGIGINGFGRIGKCCFLQLIHEPSLQIKCLNAVNISIHDIEDYLKYDSTHSNYDKTFLFKILSDDTFQINDHIIKLYSDRNPANIPWRKDGCSIIIEATGAFLTTTKCQQHDVDTVIITSPAKDSTPTYIYGVNHKNYSGERIVSASSCTTNCLAPMLHILSEKCGINSAAFTTIHASTASQYTVDIVNQKARTSRSVFNNIIPHTTGASSAISFVLPHLVGKVHGTSVRVPVVSCSLLDLNVELCNPFVNLTDVIETLKSSEYYKTVYDVSDKKLVSCDFTTTTTPCILDSNASIDMTNGRMKLMLWYDNEWAYSTQIIRLVKEVALYKNRSAINEYYSIENRDFENKGVVCRFDFNVPVNASGEIVDDFRVSSAIPTIQHILSKNPKYIVLVSHYGRPKGYDKSKSLKFLIPQLQKYLDNEIVFLEKGLCLETVKRVDELDENTKSCTIFLLENIRFHKEETNYETMTEEEINTNQIIRFYRYLGDIFVGDAFGCMHRKHMSIHYMSSLASHNYCYGFLVQKELRMISQLINQSARKLVIIGGNKIKDKLPIIDLMKSVKNTTIFVGGGLASQYKMGCSDNVYKMTDGYGAIDEESNEASYIKDISSSDEHVFDIGDESIAALCKLIDENDIIFWNGALGVIESPHYKKGSIAILDHLYKNAANKTVIIGGGDTATLVDKHSSIYVSTGGGALLEFLQNSFNNKGYLVGLDIFTN